LSTIHSTGSSHISFQPNPYTAIKSIPLHYSIQPYTTLPSNLSANPCHQYIYSNDPHSTNNSTILALFPPPSSYTSAPSL